MYTSLVEFIKKQIEVENEIAKSLNEVLDKMQNPIVKEVLRGISLDSVKHGHMYASALSILTATPQVLSKKELEEHRSIVEKHIRIEAELIESINKILPTVENEKVKFLLTAILNDERRHHELLRHVLEVIVRGETVTEGDLWDLLWKSAPFHGAPGG
ncbi:MAG: ferritin-like domain-containing protein [Candidatus Nezhaarchaeota archaeon]|nr:ferritin-like domain-containing protein [Candidatus Nezhaarchaeota archaeon]MCX8142418.1 ferritin-like domain-containing protein [Candidatus Nezhaarchaeota archaeon]MDW8050609.1 ferritin-like domain-containing protein [Nitrososphaerota archaeon]